MSDDVVETVQSTNPAITQPQHLTSEATKAASTDDILRALEGVTQEDVATAPRRPGKRGRPPGSRNLTPEERAARGRAPKPPKTPEDELKAKVEAKRKRAQEIQGQISTELNDMLMSWLISMTPLTADVLYKPGRQPVGVVRDSPYTDLGNLLAIPDNLAKSAGKLVSELEATDGGSKVAAMTQDGKAPLVIALIGTVFGAVQYARQLNPVIERLKLVNEANKAAMQALPVQQPPEDTVPVTDGTRMKAKVTA